MTEQQQETFGQSPWRIYLYDENKKFIHDDVRTSPDMPAQFDSFGLNIEMGRELTMSLARSAAEERIEAWDQANAKR
jgi:hypothetical protein